MNSKRKLVNILKRVAQLIRKGWTRGALARDKHRHVVDINSRSACKFCLLGAVKRVMDNDMSMKNEIFDSLRQAIPDDITWRSFVVYSDSQKSKFPVLRLIDRAIANAKLS